MARELKQSVSGAALIASRAATEVAVKNAHAEVEAAAKQLGEANASLAEARAQVSAGGLDRDAIREALLGEQIEQRFHDNAAAALEKAKAQLADLEAEAELASRQALSDQALEKIGAVAAAYPEMYVRSLTSLLDLMSIAAEAEKLAAEANARPLPGAEPITLPFNLGHAPKFAKVTFYDGPGKLLWEGDQYARPPRERGLP